MPVPKDVGDRTAYQLQTEQKSDLLRFSGKTELSMTPDLLLLVAYMHLMPSTGEGSQHTQVLHDRVLESHWQVCRVELSPGGFSPVLPTTAPSPEKYFPSAASRAENRAEAQPGQTRGVLRTSSEFGFESHELRIQILHTAQQPKSDGLTGIPNGAPWAPAAQTSPCLDLHIEGSPSRPGCQRWWQLWGFFSFIKGDYF